MRRTIEEKQDKVQNEQRESVFEKADKPIIGITIGDVNGIGPELLMKVFSDVRMLQLCTPVIYGSGKAINFYKTVYKNDRFNYNVIKSSEQINPKRLNFVECSPNFDKVEVGCPSVLAGAVAYQALERCSEHLKLNFLHAMVTLPIDKSTIQSENFSFHGHTEYLASRFNAQEFLMLMIHDDLRIATVTGHIPIKSVASAITAKLVYEKIRLLHETLKFDFNIERPKIAVLGLNPHAGDNGLIGAEEQQFINKAIQRATQENMLVLGAYPADGFFATMAYQKFDATLAMYHDQGLIPFKTLSAGLGVNFTAGLPIIRTSPDHGVAYDIAGKDIADDTSFRNAIYWAIDLLKTRQENQSLADNALKTASAVVDLLEGEDSILLEEEVS